MFEDEPRKRISTHEVGMPLDALSVSELEERVALLRNEISRLEAAIAARNTTRSAAEQVFKF